MLKSKFNNKCLIKVVIRPLLTIEFLIMKYTPIKVPTFSKRSPHSTTKIALAIDTSGSTKYDFRTIIFDTVKQLVASLAENGNFEIKLWAFDSFVHYQSIQIITQDNINEIDEILDITLSYGGGGSSYIESFHLINAIYGIPPHALIFITDGIFSSYETIPNDITIEKHVIHLNNIDHPFKHEIFPFEHFVHVLNYSDKI